MVIIGVGNWLILYSLYVINLIWCLYHVSCHVIVCKSSHGYYDIDVFSTWRCEQLKSSPIAAKLEKKNQGNGIRMSYVFRQGDLPKLDLQVDRGTDFTAWKAQWEAYRSLSGLDKESQVKQVKALTLCFSRETLSSTTLALQRSREGASPPS